MANSTHLYWNWPGRNVQKFGIKFHLTSWARQDPRVRCSGVNNSPTWNWKGKLNCRQKLRRKTVIIQCRTNLSVWDSTNPHSISDGCHQQWGDKRCLQNASYVLPPPCMHGPRLVAWWEDWKFFKPEEQCSPTPRQGAGLQEQEQRGRWTWAGQSSQTGTLVPTWYEKSLWRKFIEIYWPIGPRILNCCSVYKGDGHQEHPWKSRRVNMSHI